MSNIPPAEQQPYPNQNDAQVGDQSQPYRKTPAAAGRNGMAIASMVLGVIGIVLAFISPIIGVILGIIALVLGIVARRRGEAVPGHGRGLILAGIILGSLAIVVAVVNFIVAQVIFANHS